MGIGLLFGTAIQRGLPVSLPFPPRWGDRIFGWAIDGADVRDSFRSSGHLSGLGQRSIGRLCCHRTVAFYRGSVYGDAAEWHPNACQGGQGQAGVRWTGGALDNEQWNSCGGVVEGSRDEGKQFRVNSHHTALPSCLLYVRTPPSLSPYLSAPDFTVPPIPPFYRGSLCPNPLLPNSEVVGRVRLRWV